MQLPLVNSSSGVSGGVGKADLERISYPASMAGSLSAADEGKEVNRLHQALGAFIKERRNNNNLEFKGIALIIGSSNGGEIQTNPKFLDSSIQKFYIDPGHIKWNEDQSVSPASADSYIVSITANNGSIIQRVLSTLLKEGGEVTIYDNCSPAGFGGNTDFTYSCAKHIIEHTGQERHKDLHVVIGYFDDYPRFLVENEFFYNGKNTEFADFIMKTKINEEKTHYERFLKSVDDLNNMHVKIFPDDVFIL